MRLKLTAPALAFVVAILYVAPGRTLRAGAARGAGAVLLPGHILLHSGTLTLADLLPASAPSRLRVEAGKVLLGSAPQPTMTRTIYRQQLQYLLKDHASLLAELSLPPQISVQRFHRAITKSEVIRAINRALGSQGLTHPPDLSNIEFSAPVYATGADPGIEVIRISSDPLRHVTNFRLWTSKEPGNLPFTVAVPREIKLPTLVARHMLASGDIASATDFSVEMRPQNRKTSSTTTTANDLSGLATRGLVRAGEPVDRDQFARPVLVEPGALATLIVEGNGFNIKTIVTPLQQGVLGQEIRVRNTESKQVVEAQVTGRDRLTKSR
ncbi:MAG: flagellar basal body P-ring formation chaperone FlgA [Terriglobia bacterium]